MRIDAHQHFWLLADHAGGWPGPELTAIHHDRLPADLAPLLARHGIAATVLVQALPSESETHWMLALADRHDFIAAVVGWADLKAHDAPQRIAALATHPKLAGLRPMLQDCDDNWIADPLLAPAIGAMLARDLAFDALVRPRHLPALLTFARRFPQLRIVIDHCAKPDMSGARPQPWRDAIAELAACPNVSCKLSGLVTEAVGAARPHWRLADLRPWFEHVLDCFGPDRLLWGSDWPVLDLAGGMGRWVAATEALLADLPPETRAAIFGGNARTFYRLPPAASIR